MEKFFTVTIIFFMGFTPIYSRGWMGRQEDGIGDVRVNNHSPTIMGPNQIKKKNTLKAQPVPNPIEKNTPYQNRSSRYHLKERKDLKAQELADQIRSQIKKDRKPFDWFTEEFFTSREGYPKFAKNKTNFWNHATAEKVKNLLNWSETPIYYDYYSSYPQEYFDENAYNQETTRPAPLQNYQIQNDFIGEKEKEHTSDTIPLGIFALSKENGDVITPNMFFQLSLSKNGKIVGTSYNSTTDKLHDIEGVFIPKTQMSVFKIANGTTPPIIEVGAYNLTEPQAKARIYYGNGETKEIFLVRLEETQEKK